MNLNWFESMLYGLFSGLTDILPLSAQAHKTLMLKFFGIRGDMGLMNLMVHLGIVLALYFNCQTQLIRMRRAQALARTPKKKRRRPLDVRSMMDASLLRTMVISALLGLLLYRYTKSMEGNLVLLALFLFLNGIILYVPQFLPGGNRDSRTLSRVEGLLMGLGGAVSVVPGMSAMGVTMSVGSVCGVDRTYALDLALMLNLFVNIGWVVYDVMGIMNDGVGLLSVVILLRYLMTMGIAAGAAALGIRIMRYLASEQGYAFFGFYCFGQALFAFVLNLMA